MYIHELAEKADISNHIVRYYIRVGLLKPCGREENGYKIFALSDVEKLHLIREAKKLGFTLSEIGDLLNKRFLDNTVCKSTAINILRNRIKETQQKINDLMDLEHSIDDVLSDIENPAVWGDLKKLIFPNCNHDYEGTGCI